MYTVYTRCIYIICRYIYIYIYIYISIHGQVKTRKGLTARLLCGTLEGPDAVPPTTILPNIYHYQTITKDITRCGAADHNITSYNITDAMPPTAVLLKRLGNYKHMYL